MNLQEYYEISKKEKLPKRCPILNICERRWATIYYFSYYPAGESNSTRFDYLKQIGEMDKDFDYINLIELQGELCSYSKFIDGISFFNMCPEVSLFDSSHGMGGIGEVACISASYERGEKFKLIEFRHYSECPEFCYWHYNNSFKKSSATKRTGLSKRIKFEIMQRDNFTCQYCGRSKDDGITLHVDHKIPVSKGGTDNFDNLITSCSECNIGKSNKII